MRSASLLHGPGPPDPPNTSVVRAWLRDYRRLPSDRASRRAPTDRACRRARDGQGQALRVAPIAPSLTAPARDGQGNCGRDGRMLAARVEQKNERENDDMTPLDNKRPIQGRDPVHLAARSWMRACEAMRRKLAREVARSPT